MTVNISKVSIISFVLGSIFSVCVYLFVIFGFYASLLGYIGVLCLFHFLEFYCISLSTPYRELSIDAFLLNHSKEYHFSIVAAIVEHGIRSYYMSWHGTIVNICVPFGLFLILMGQLFRSWPMIWAGSNFSHLVAERKTPHHRLVTDGPYRYVRHPSYTGYFVWSLGTQVFLCNPISFIGYTCFLWKFFRERIEYEEYTLVRFFGEDYVSYQHKVVSGIPFVK